MTRGRLEDLERFLASVDGRVGDDLTSAELVRLEYLIDEALRADYTAASCKDGIQTGNHYQSIQLGETRTEGFRSDRHEFLDLVDFGGRSVLDLGSNLGELSRSARSRGAREVCGIEYDPWFLTIARAVNVYNGVTDVRFVQGDITDEATLDHEADIVLAFSVFTYVGEVLPRVAEITQEILVVETHNLNGNLERDYLQPIGRFFGHHVVLGSSDWGRSFRPTEGRAVIAFAKDAETLERVVTEPERPIALAATGEPAAEPPPPAAPEVMGAQLDVGRTAQALHARFFQMFAFRSTDDLLAAVGSLQLDAEAFARGHDARGGYSGWLYWAMLLKGWLAHREGGGGAVRDDDAYLEHWLDRHLAVVDEPGRSDRRDAAAAKTLVERRYADLDALKAWSDGGRAGAAPDLRPVRVIVGDLPRDHGLPVALIGSDEPLAARSIDGWHRIFAARLFGLSRLRCEVVEETYPLVDGAVERVAYDGRSLEVVGWVLNRERRAGWFELRAGGRTLCRRALSERPDVAARYPGTEHAGRAGFVARWTGRLSGAEIAGLEVLAMEDWLPVGRLMVPSRR